MCISDNQVCDGISDCFDRSDENYCYNCLSRGLFQCGGAQCVLPSDRCDNKRDCVDNSDELGCFQTTQPMCFSYQFSCGNGQCIYERWVCDREEDCSNGADEIGCKNSTDCGHDQISCEMNFGCIAMSEFCDGIKNCPDNSDEKYCNVTTSAPHSVCLNNFFNCGYGICIPIYQKCNRVFDCLNNLDENGCSMAYSGNQISTVDYWVSSDHINVTIGPPIYPVNVPFTVQISLYNQVSEFILVRNVAGIHFPIIEGFSGLTPLTRYTLLVRFMVNDNATSDIVSREITTLVLIPTNLKPLNVTGEVKYFEDDVHLNLKWTAIPSVMRYKVEYFSRTSENVKVVYTTVEHYSFNSELLLLGQSYTFKVYAFINDVWSRPSDPVVVVFTIDCLNGYVNAANSDSRNYDAELADFWYGKDLLVTWVPLNNSMAQYNLRMICVDEFQDIVHIPTKEFLITINEINFKDYCGPINCNIKVTRLNPGSNYKFIISGKKKPDNIYVPPCDSKGFLGTADGVLMATPIINILRISRGVATLAFLVEDNGVFKDISQGTIIIYFWHSDETHDNPNNPPKIYNVTQIFRSDVAKKGDHLTIDKLDSCSTYCFAGQIIWPVRSQTTQQQCLSSKNDVDDVAAPPKHVNVAVVNLNVELMKADLRITWEPPCLPGSRDYIIAVEEISTKFVNYFTYYDVAGAMEISYTVTGLTRGMFYGISVGRDKPLGRMSNPEILQIEPIRAPLNLTYEKVEQVGVVLLLLRWNPPQEKLPEDSRYAIFYATNNKFEGGTKLGESAKNSYFIQDFLDYTKNIYLKVCVITKSNNLGLDSEHIWIPADANATNTGVSTGKKMSTAALALVIVAGSAVFIVLVSITLFFFLKYHRLRNSLNDFQRSHYNTESSRATFGDIGDDDELIINNFAEDEPLMMG